MHKHSIIITIVVVIAVVLLGVITTRDNRDNAVSQNATSTDQTQQATSTYFFNHSDALAGTSTDYYPENEDVAGYLSVPEDASEANPAPGVVLIHEWWGLNEDIKQMADDYASKGYAALAVDMYGAEPTSSSTVARKRAQSVRENMDAAMTNLQAAVDYLKSRSDVDEERIASVGWCFGGGWAYRMAVNDIGVDASVMYYGQFDPQDDYQNMRASILGHFGEEDRVVDVSNAREFKAQLENADQSSAVYIYPNVGHSFANYRGGDSLEYSRDKARKAWVRTLDFLRRQL